MNYNYEQLNPDSEKHLQAIAQVAEWSVDCSSMKEYSTDTLMQHTLSVLAFAEGTDDFLGHVAITEVNQQKPTMVGALAVAGDFQGNGVAKGLVAQQMEIAFAQLPEIKKYQAFVHPGSLNAFLANGFTVVGPREPAVHTGCNTIVSLNLVGVNGNE